MHLFKNVIFTALISWSAVLLCTKEITIITNYGPYTIDANLMPEAEFTIINLKNIDFDTLDKIVAILKIIKENEPIKSYELASQIQTEKIINCHFSNYQEHQLLINVAKSLGLTKIKKAIEVIYSWD